MNIKCPTKSPWLIWAGYEWWHVFFLTSRDVTKTFWTMYKQVQMVPGIPAKRRKNKGTLRGDGGSIRWTELLWKQSDLTLRRARLAWSREPGWAPRSCFNPTGTTVCLEVDRDSALHAARLACTKPRLAAFKPLMICANRATTPRIVLIHLIPSSVSPESAGATTSATSTDTASLSAESPVCLYLYL